MYRCVLTLAALAPFTGCKQDSKLTKHPDGADGAYDFPTIQVEPEAINFGSLQAGETATEIITITNVGTDMSVLEVSAITLTIGADAGFSIVESPGAHELKHQESSDVVVSFTAMEPVEASGQVVVESNDEDTPQVPASLEGAGVMPYLTVSPDPYEYGEVTVGCETEGEFVLRNDGNASVEITAIASEGASFDLLERPMLPLVLEPEEYATLRTSFAPSSGVAFTGTVIVESDDPRGTLRAGQVGSGVHPGTYVDTYMVPTAGAIDLVFAVDQSVSMDDEQVALALQAQAFAASLASVTDDARIMVVSSDDGCNVGGIMTPDMPDFAERFAEAVQAGSESESGWGLYTEALIYLSAMAVLEQDAPHACNEGFVRPEALLHIIYVSDEGYDLDGVVDQPWWWYLDDLRALKGADYLVKTSAVAGDVPSGCDSPTNHAGPATGYAEIVEETHGGFLSICGDWSTEVDTVAAYGISRDTFALSHWPDPVTIEVMVNGIRVGGWHYMSDSNSVEFDTNAPQSGDTVDIAFTVPLTCY